MDYFDLHCDTLFEIYKHKQHLYSNKLSVSFEKGSIFRSWCQVFAIWIPDLVDSPFDLFLNILEYSKTEFENNKEYSNICTDADQLKATLDAGKCASILSVEGGRVLEGNIDNLIKIYQHGIRLLTLTWNDKNEIASGCLSDGGLTEFGEKVVASMNDLKMAVDLSHLNEFSFDQAIDISEYVLATHSNSKTVHTHYRNLSDNRLIKLSKRNALVGICFYPEFLGSGNVYESIYKNISLLLDLGLASNISLGSDFDGAVMNPSLADISKVPKLHEYLLSRNIKKDIIDNIFFNNAYNYFSNLLTNRL